MIRRIARKEIQDTLRDGRFRWGGLVVVSLLLIALGAGWTHRAEIAATHEAATSQTWEHWFAQEEKNPHSAAHYGVYAFKPVTALSLIDQGLDPYTGVATWLEAHRQNPFEFRPAQDGTAVARFGVLTAAGVMQLLIPLLIILFAFSSVSGERESGTLRQVLSLGVRPRDLLWGKVVGVGGALALLLVPAALLGGLALSAGRGGGGEWPALLLTALLYLAYFAVFVLVTLAASAWIRSSRVALVTLLAFWIVNALIVPRAAADLAESLHPLPTTVEFDAAVQQARDLGLDGRTPSAQRDAALQDSVLRAYGASSPAELPINFAGVSLQAREEYGYLVSDHHYGAVEATMLRQAGVHRRASLLAPLLATRELSMGLAGTDLARHRHFVKAAEEHRRLIQRLMNDDIALNSRWGDEHVAGPELWATVPPFHYDPPPLGESLRGTGGAAAVLAGWLGLGVLLLLGGARRLGPEAS